MGIATASAGTDRSTQAERIRRPGRTALLAALLLSGLPVKPASALESVIDIKRMSIEQLMNIPVTTPHVMLETIDRIEVVRGPGGALWGASAVNGMINIVTRNARDSQGMLITAGAGTGDAGLFARIRWEF